MKKNLTTLFIALLSCLFVGAQPLLSEGRPRASHHTHYLPGVNERRLERLEKMREANLALRHRQGPWRAQTVPQTKKGLVLLVNFSDVSMKEKADTLWWNRFNQQGFSGNNHVGSVRDYFIEQSYGLLTIDFDVIGPLTLSKTRTYYGTRVNNSVGDRAAEMVIDALKLANSQVNYADYDWDGDGWVDQVYVIYAGETYPNTQGYIWPHEWSLGSAQYYGCGAGRQRLDNVYIDTYAVSNELAGDKSTLEGIGTACHEFSHCLGYPDFYDAEYNGGTAAQNWDVLDGGSYNGPNRIGEIPSPYTAYERWTAGWIDLIPLTQPTRVTDMPAINEEGVAYIIKNTGNTNEYYILENRQQIGFGKGNKGHGLMVWHIDYNQSNWSTNTVNTDPDHQRMTFLPADGKVGDLVEDGGYYYYQSTSVDEAGDPYPGIQQVTSVQQLTWFRAERYGTKTHQNLIHNITESADGKIGFIYGDYIPLQTPDLAMPTNISADGFTANWTSVKDATSYTLQVEAMSDEHEPKSILEEDFSKFSSVNNGSQVSASIIDEYTQTAGWGASAVYGTSDAFVLLGAASRAGYMTTPALENLAGALIVEFDASYYDTDKSSIVVSVLNGTQIVASETVQLTDTRATYNLTFEDVPEGCQVKFATPSRGKRVYLYNINIQDMSGVIGKVTTIGGLTTISYTVSPIEAKLYYYRVQAVGKDGTSDWSEWMEVDLSAVIDGMSSPFSFEGDKGDIYDLTGRRLQGIPQHGIYIQGGKKHLVR